MTSPTLDSSSTTSSPHTHSPGGLTLDSAALVSELFKERKRDRRASLIRTGLFAVLGLGYALWMLLVFSAASPSSPPQESFAAVVRITGLIADGKPASYEKLAPLLRKAFTHPNSAGVILQINSPGGTPVQSALIHDLIVELKTTTKKPVIAVAEDMMTSGAYMIAVAADKIVANRSSVVGSIGVISAGFGFQSLIEKLGVERRVFTAGDSKSMMDPFKPLNQEEVARQEELLEDIHTHFKDLVIDSRKDRLNLDTKGLFEGRVWTGERAVALGLIDELGRVDQVIKKELKVTKAYPFEVKKPFMQSIMEDFSVRAVHELVSVASTPALR